MAEKEEKKTQDMNPESAEGASNAPVVLEEIKPITVVIPYAKELAQGKELLFALRSICVNSHFPGKIVIIGDREDWFSDEVTVIPHTRVSDNPQIDTIEKLKIAIDSELVSDKFIWSNDDIYFISPVLLADIEVLKIKGILTPSSFSGAYRDNMIRTIDLLGGGEVPDFETHTPVIFEKEKLITLFEKFPELSTGGYLISSIYFNVLFPSFIPMVLDWKEDQCLLPVVSQGWDINVFNKLISKKKFLNNAESGYSENLIKRLSDLFPDKSDLEK
ncbi:hypothetical protein [uncultured Bacteroides sp.]|uniref:hypothetical protein n=1 Tax=uncultured Bacteroides sp. TaxID=162156 RepID=UPI002AAA72DC|nr:hypothetical protein [uncultured Bacteroides sp.]